MKQVNPTVARIVKKSLWRDIKRWLDEDYASDAIEIDTSNKRKILRRAQVLTKKKDGVFYVGSILCEVARFPSRNELVVLTWDTYMYSKRLAIFPVIYDKNFECDRQRGIAITEHAIERMAGRLNTLNRREIIRELAAAAMPSCFLVMNFLNTPEHGEHYVIKTPHGLGILAINYFDDPDIVGFLVTWISDEEVTARKFQAIDWVRLQRKVKTNDGTITIDLAAGATMYLPHLLSENWAKQVIHDQRKNR
jgi:hypothetical protein